MIILIRNLIFSRNKDLVANYWGRSGAGCLMLLSSVLIVDKKKALEDIFIEPGIPAIKWHIHIRFHIYFNLTSCGNKKPTYSDPC